MEAHRSFISLLIVVALAFAVPVVLARIKRLRLPIVVGEILAGIAVGLTGFNLVNRHDAALALLSDFGFVFLFLLAGMEIDFTSLHRPPSRGARNGSREWGALTLGVLSFAGTILLAALTALAMTRAGLAQNPYMIALILSPSALGIIVAVLKESNFSAGRFGQAILVAALLADFGSMILLTAMVALLSRGVTLDILLIGLIFVAFLTLYRIGVFLSRIRAVRHALEELSHTTAQIKIRAAFALLMVFVVLSEVLGAEIALGAFLAGAMIALLSTPEDDAAKHQLESIGFGFFIPIFFVMVGVNFNLSALRSSPQAILLVPVLLLAAVAVKIIPALIFRVSFTWRETLAAGTLLAARLSLIVAASAIGLRLGLIGEPANAAIVLSAMILATAAPLLFLRIVPRKEAAAQPTTVIAGADALGLQVAEQMKAHRERAVLIDERGECVARARKHGFEAAEAFVDRPDPRATPYLDSAATLICTYTDADLNLAVCRLAKATYGIDHIVAYVNEAHDISRFEQLGVATMNPALDRAALLVLIARNPALHELLNRYGGGQEMAEVVLTEPRHSGRKLRQLPLPGNVLIVAMRRDGEVLVPHGDTELELGDHLTLAGSLDCIDEARAIFAGRSD